MTALEPEVGGGLRDVALVVLERAEDEIALDLVHHRLERRAGSIDAAAGSAARRQVRAHVPLPDRVVLREDHEALDQVLELADVAGEVVLLDRRERSVGELLLL